MDKINSAATQARRIHCPRCGHRHWPKPARSPGHRRDFLLHIYRDRHRHPGLADSTEGRIFLMILRSLGLPLEDVDNLASWITLKELREIDKVAKPFKPSAANVGEQIHFTDAEREHYSERYGIFLIRSCESDWNVEHQERTKCNNEKRTERRPEKRHADEKVVQPK